MWRTGFGFSRKSYTEQMIKRLKDSGFKVIDLGEKYCDIKIEDGGYTYYFKILSNIKFLTEEMLEGMLERFSELGGRGVLIVNEFRLLGDVGKVLEKNGIEVISTSQVRGTGVANSVGKQDSFLMRWIKRNLEGY